MGKGSGRRPGHIPDGAWEKIFGKKDKENGKDSKKENTIPNAGKR